jgi:hypothetical protein
MLFFKDMDYNKIMDKNPPQSPFLKGGRPLAERQGDFYR